MLKSAEHKITIDTVVQVDVIRVRRTGNGIRDRKLPLIKLTATGVRF